MTLQNLFPWLLFAHVLAALVAIGPNFAYSTIRSMGRTEPQHANFATRVTHAISDRLVYPVGLVIPLTGFAMIVVAAIDLTSRTYWWLDLAIATYTAIYLYSFFVQRPLVGRIISMTSTPPAPGGAISPEVPVLARRAQPGGTVMLVLLGLVVFLMVLKPQI